MVIAREIGDRRGEGSALGNLGNGLRRSRPGREGEELLHAALYATGFASAARPKACTLLMDRSSNTQSVCTRRCYPSGVFFPVLSDMYSCPLYFSAAQDHTMAACLAINLTEKESNITTSPVTFTS